MITLSNRYDLEFVAASGAFGFSGNGYWWDYPFKLLGVFDTSLFTPITKTITYLPRKGNCKWYNPFSCVRFIKDGVVNIMGLPNPGIFEWANKNKNFNGIVSIYIENNDYTYYILREMLTILNKIDIKAIELNVSCPNIYTNTDTTYFSDFDGRIIEWLIKEIKAHTDIPIILKLSVANRIDNLFENFSIDKYVEAISINSVPWDIAYKDMCSPFEKYENENYGIGGVSGKAAQKHNWLFIMHLANITDIPIIGADVWDYKDIAKLYDIGCQAIAFGSLFLKYPWKPTTYVKRFLKENKKRLNDNRQSKK